MNVREVLELCMYECERGSRNVHVNREYVSDWKASNVV